MNLEKFESDDDLLRFFRERADDVESVEFSIRMMVDPNVSDEPFAAVFKRADGQKWTLQAEQLQRLINGGLLNRMNVPVKLLIPDDSRA